MAVALAGLAVGLKAELLLPQQFAHDRMLTRCPRRRVRRDSAQTLQVQRNGDIGSPRASARPARSSRREVSGPSRPALCGRRPNGGCARLQPRRRREFIQAAADGACGDAGDPRHCRNAAVTGGRGFSSCEQPPPAFVEMRRQTSKRSRIRATSSMPAHRIRSQTWESPTSHPIQLFPDGP